MNNQTLLAGAAALGGAVLAVGALLRRGGRPVASWSFSLGMILLAGESLLAAMNPWTVALEAGGSRGPTLLLLALARSLVPGTWLCFSLTYARGNAPDYLRQSRFLLAAAFLLPPGLTLFLLRGWFPASAATRALDVVFLVVTVLILTNLERTFRAAVGTMRWRIKFLVLGVVLVFGARLYTLSQALLFPGHTPALDGFEPAALLLGSVPMAVAYARSGLAGVDVYPSHAILRSSFTLLLAGGYLLVVGVLAQVVTALGGPTYLQAQAFVVLLGIALLASLLLSDRLRQTLKWFVSRHFKRPQHDFRRVWSLFTQRTVNARDEPGLCAAVARLISETFGALSVTLWVLDERTNRLTLGASTAPPEARARDDDDNPDGPRASLPDGDPGTPAAWRGGHQPFDLETMPGNWAESLRRTGAAQFRTGGHRLGVPLLCGDRWLGVAVLADRVGGVAYTPEEFDLLACLGDQTAASLLNLRLTGDLMLAKQLEAFQTMSAFFVHDLKNAVSGLSLMLQNLPVHFDDPAFRRDALRGVASTVDRINQIIGRLGVLRHKLELHPAESDLNQLVRDALDGLPGTVPGVEWSPDLRATALRVMADREQLLNVVTNLLLNAREAVGNTAGGQIRVHTRERDGQAVLSIADNGCGMSAGFLRDYLFRPFHTTKKKGLGIGTFQSKIIVEAHRGTIQVESEPGKGTTFRVILPLNPRVA